MQKAHATIAGVYTFCPLSVYKAHTIYANYLCGMRHSHAQASIVSGHNAGNKHFYIICVSFN